MTFDKYVAMTALCLAIEGCGDESPAPATQGNVAVNDIGNHPNVYFAGETKNAAVVWRNGSADTLATESVAQSVFVDGNDTYVVGWQWSLSGMAFAMYWKNGTPVLLSDGITPTYAKSIAVSKGNVYVAGFESGNVVTARCWKNGLPLPLSSKGTQGTIAVSLFVSGNDVYVAGWVFNEKGQTVAAYWKNGDLVLLTDGASPSIAESVFVSGGDVYVAGTTNFDAGQILPTEIFSSGPEGTATYWKNGAPVTLSTNGRARSVFVNGTDVYVSGSVYDTNIVGITPIGPTFEDAAVYWKNGEMTKLVDDAASDAYSISVTKNGDVYNAGTISNQAVYWINQDAQHLPVPDQGQGYLYSVFLTN